MRHHVIETELEMAQTAPVTAPATSAAMLITTIPEEGAALHCWREERNTTSSAPKTKAANTKGNDCLAASGLSTKTSLQLYIFLSYFLHICIRRLLSFICNRGDQRERIADHLEEQGAGVRGERASL
jgi:hypothetical protein